MIDKIKIFFTKYEWVLVALFVLTFILVRLAGTGLPLHQDEYKWLGVGAPTTQVGLIPHPPLGELIYQAGGSIVGFNNNFRFIPLFFGSVNLVLLWCLMKVIFGRREAFIASFIWIFSYFSVLASLMVDTDGAVMPFFFLVSLIGYYKLKSSDSKERFWWGILLAVGLICGLLIKVSFLLAIGAIIADFLWSKRGLITRKDLLNYSFYAFVSIILFIGLLFVLKAIFPFFDLKNA